MLWLVALACRPSSDPGTRIVLVVVDGVRVEESVSQLPSELSGLTGPEHWPLIHQDLLPEATLVLGFRNMGTTITAPAHATLATGTRTPLANMPVDNGPGLYRPELPLLGEELERQGEGSSLWMANQSLISPLTWSLMPGFEEESDFILISQAVGEIQPAQADEPVWPKLARTLSEDRPQLVMVNLKAVDRSGHYGEPGFKPYLEAVDAVDAPLVRLWDNLQQDPWYADRTVLIITTDHGRHRDTGEDEDYWRNHGDWSAGDREGFAILIGPDILRNEVIETPYTLEDLAPTVAALAGIDLPWADGLPMRDALSVHRTTKPREGVSHIAVEGDFLVEEVFRDDPTQRSVIRYQGKRLSSAEAWAAEAPVVAADGDRAAACWREVVLDELSMPWVGRCVLLSDDEVWDLDFPEAVVNPFWEPDLRWNDGVLEVAYAHNPYDIVQTGVDRDVGARLASWDGERWTVLDEPGQLLYPSWVQHSLDGLLYVASSEGNDARQERRLYLDEFGKEPELLETPLAQPLNGGWLVARPAARGSRIIAVGVGDSERLVFELNRNTGEERVLARDEKIPVHLSPVWAGSTPVWALQGERAQVCTEEHCIDVGERIRDLDYDGEALWVVVQDGGPWEAKRL